MDDPVAKVILHLAELQMKTANIMSYLATAVNYKGSLRQDAIGAARAEILGLISRVQSLHRVLNPLDKRKLVFMDDTLGDTESRS